MRYLLYQYTSAILLTLHMVISNLILLVNRCFSVTSGDQGLFLKVEIVLLALYFESNHTPRPSQIFTERSVDYEYT